MSIVSVISRLQEKLHITKSELFCVCIVLMGLLIGSVVKLTSTGFDSKNNSNHAIFHALDSLAEAQRTTYIGTDMDGNSFEELTKADTVVEKESYFPKSDKTKEDIGKININTASRVQLMKLSGIGEKTADKIIKYRKEHLFMKIEEIMDIKGIGKKKFEKIKEKITVDD